MDVLRQSTGSNETAGNTSISLSAGTNKSTDESYSSSDEANMLSRAAKRISVEAGEPAEAEGHANSKLLSVVLKYRVR